MPKSTARVGDEWAGPGLGIAKKRFQVISGGPGELIKKGPRNLILLSNLGHLAVGALIDPNVFHNFDTALRI